MVLKGKWGEEGLSEQFICKILDSLAALQGLNQDNIHLNLMVMIEVTIFHK